MKRVQPASWLRRRNWASRAEGSWKAWLAPRKDWTVGLLSSQLLGVLLRIGELGEVDQRQGEFQGRGNELDRLAVLLPDAGPQRFMSLHDLLEAHLECVALQGSIEVDREGAVVANL